MKFTQMSLYRHCFHDKPSRPIRRAIPTGHRHCRWNARKPVQTACENSPQCTNSGMQVVLLRVAAQRAGSRERATRPCSQRGFPFPHKHLRSVQETKRIHLRHLPSHPCRELSKYREVSVDNAVNAIPDSVAYKFYIFKTRLVQGHGTAVHRDPVPGRAAPAGSLAAARNEGKRLQRRCTERGDSRPRIRQLHLARFCWIWLSLNRKQGRTGALGAAGRLLPRQRPDDAHRNAIRATTARCRAINRPGSGQHAGTSVGTSCPCTNPEV
ncbi:hypothetical protein HEP75_01229 [Xanthomonas sp. SI]|nr:hypothetical protein HEP75_01229 [Xanthomonas sp. SI]